jgi:hypothetical protein
MRVTSGGGSVGLGLTHKILSPKSVLPSRPLGSSRFFHPSPLTNAKRILPKTTTPIAFKMADTQEWNALRVRETFLNYFKERGHTFGSSIYIYIPLHLLASDTHNPFVALQFLRLQLSRSRTQHYSLPMLE